MKFHNGDALIKTYRTDAPLSLVVEIKIGKLRAMNSICAWEVTISITGQPGSYKV